MLLEFKTNNVALLNLQLYAAWIFEITMVFVSVLTWVIPYATFVVLAITKRPAVCRLCIVIVYLKFMSTFVTS